PLGERGGVVGLDEPLAPLRFALHAVADPHLVLAALEPGRYQLNAGRQRAGRQVLVLAPAQPRPEEHAQGRRDELIDAEPGAPRDPAPIVRHRADAAPPAVVAAQREDVAPAQLADDVRQARKVAVDVAGRVNAERVAPVADAHADGGAGPEGWRPQHRTV